MTDHDKVDRFGRVNFRRSYASLKALLTHAECARFYDLARRFALE